MTEIPDWRTDTRWRSLMLDLDRCEHGRHEGDVCFGCGGPSLGNPLMGSQDGRAAYEVVPRQIGFTISGTPIVVPERGEMHLPDAWLDSGREVQS